MSRYFREKVILAPGCSESELLRSLAKKGINTLGYRVVSDVELSKLALMKSGISITEEFLSVREEPSVIFSFLNSIGYFGAASYADAESMAQAMHTMRSLIRENEEKCLKDGLNGGEFPEKNDAILSVYERYQEILKKAEKIDSIGIVRKALKEAMPFDADFAIFEEFPLSPMDEALIEKISGGHYETFSIADLFGDNKKKPEGLTYTEGYGEINEVEAIIDDIYRNKIPVDTCTVAFPGGSVYPQTFFDLAKRYDLPITFGSGIPIVNSYPARLLKLISEWDTTGYHGIDALRLIIRSEAFDRKKLESVLTGESLKYDEIENIIKMAGNLRLSFDKNDNEKKLAAYRPVVKDLKTFERVEKLAKELGYGFTLFFDKYTLVRPEPAKRIDISAKQVIAESLGAYETYAKAEDINDIIPQLLSKSVCSENSKEGCLHLTTITGAISVQRDNLFVCGLSAADFPGSTKENYLLLDSDLIKIAGDEKKAPTSLNRIDKNITGLKNLLEIASGLGSKIKLSYSGYGLSDLKEKNPSSVLFGYYEDEHPGADMNAFKASIKKAGYFDSDIDSIRLIGKEYTKGLESEFKPEKAEPVNAKSALECDWSPTVLETFFQCPRCFYFLRILHIPEDEPDNPFDVITAKDIGTIAHSLMEKLATEKMTKEGFTAAAGKAFDDYLLGRPPMHEEEAKRSRKDFLKMMETAYDMEISIGNEVVLSEETVTFEHPEGVKLLGRLDRVEKDKEGNYIVVDFKTGYTVKHVENDINTCLQAVTYAWMCEQKGINISRCEYRYFKKNRIIPCVYDETKKTELAEKLKQFKAAVESNDFPCAEDESACKYCKYKDICNRATEKEKEEE